MVPSRKPLRSRAKKQLSQCQIIAISLLWIVGFLVLIHSKRTKAGTTEVSPLPGCRNEIHIWSHRTHSPGQVDCKRSLQSLSSAGIRHLDVDVLVDIQGHLLIAHPSELPGSHDADFQRAPCSNMEFSAFLEQLIEAFQGDFFLTMEPKANWPGQAHNDALSEPKIVVDRLLYELPDSVLSSSQCGIILSDVQMKYLGSSLYSQDLLRACNDLVFPLSIRSPFQLPPRKPPYTMYMPTIEHHESLIQQASLSTEQIMVPTVVWIVDDIKRLTQALNIGGAVQGVITNQPIRIQELLREICRG